MQTHADSCRLMQALIVIAVSVSPDDEPCFVESVGCVLLVSRTPLVSAILPSLFHGVSGALPII